MNLDDNDLVIIRRACQLVGTPPGMERADLEQEVACRLLGQALTTPRTDGLIWFLARQRARLVAARTAHQPDALPYDPAAFDVTDDEWGETLARLSWRDRTMLDLRYRLGLTLGEIARAMHMNCGEIKWHIPKAERRYVVAKKKKMKGGRPC